LKNSANAGIGFLLIALACFAFLDTITKQVLLTVPVLMVIWVRFVVQALLTTIFMLPRTGRGTFETKKPFAQLLRGALLLLCTLLACNSLKFMPVGEFAAISMTAPLFVTLLASRLLGEHVSGLRIALVCGGLIGALLIVRPGGATFGWAVLFPLGLVIANTTFQLLTSKITLTEKSTNTHFYSVWIGAAISTVLLVWGWQPITDLQLWARLILIGAAGAMGHFMLIVAFEKAPAATLMPYMYAQIAFAIFGGWLLFGHFPGALSMMGVGIIALCGIAAGVLTVVERKKLTPPVFTAAKELI
jgi:drug/metabolite transporter (DMT)-like permease